MQLAKAEIDEKTGEPTIKASDKFLSMMQEYFTDLASGKRLRTKDIGVDRVDGLTPDLVDEYEESQSGSSAASRRRNRTTANRGSNKLSYNANEVSDFKTVGARGHRRNRTSGNGGINSSLEGKPGTGPNSSRGRKAGKKGKRGRKNRKSRAYGDEYDSYDEESDYGDEYDDEYGSEDENIDG